MSNRMRAVTAFAGIALAFSSSQALATNVGAASNMSTIQASVTGDGIINFDQTGALTMDANGTGVASITVATGVTATINWGTSSFKIVFKNAAGAITLNGNSTMTFTNGGANNGFDFANTASAKTLTVTSSSAGSLGADLAGNILLLGNGNTVVFAVGGGAAHALDTVLITNAASAAPIIDVNATLTIDTLTIGISGDDVDVDVADGITATVTDAVSLVGDSILEVIASGAGGDDTLAFTAGLSLGGTSTLRLTNDTGQVTGGVTSAADGVTIDVNGTAKINAISMTTTSGDTTLAVATGKTLTTVVDINANTLILSEAGTVSTINLDTAAGVLDVNESCTVTTCDVSVGGSTVDVASTKTLTVTNGVDTNDQILTLNNTGTISKVDIDGTGGTVRLTAATATITTLTHTAAGTIDLDTDLCNLTVTNDIVSGNLKLTLNGSGAGGAETLTAVVDLSGGTSSELEVTGADVDAIVITEIDVSVDGSTVDTAINFAPTLIDMNAAAGNLTIESGGKVVTTVVDVNDNTLVLSETGTVSTVNLDTATGILDVNESCTITTCDVSVGASTVDVASTKTLTVTNGVDTNDQILTLNNTGTISKVDIDGAAGTVRLTAATATITTLTHAAAGTIDLDTDLCNLTVTNDIVSGNRKLILNGSGAGGVETLTATVDLSGGTSAELEVTGVDADAIVVTKIDVSVDGATVDTAINFAPTLIDMNAAAGNLTLETGGKTVTTSVDVNDNTLTLSETGTVSTVTVDTANGIVDVDQNITISTLTPTESCNLTIAAGKTLTVTNAVTVPTTKILTFTGTNDASAETLTLSGGLTLVGPSGELNVTGDNTTAMVVGGTITAGTANGAILDVDATTTLAALTPTKSIDLQIADGKTLTITAAVTVPDSSTVTVTGTTNAAGETLVLSNPMVLGGGTSGTLNITGDSANAFTVTGTIQPAAGSTLDVDQSTSVTAVTLSGSATVDVASGKTLTTTTTVAANTLTSAGAGTFTRVDATTGQITDNGGATFSDLRLTPGSGTFTFAGTGATTITDLTNSTFAADTLVVNKTGSGSVSLVTGVNTLFVTAGIQVINVTDGTLIVGAAGTNDDITFSQDGDEITAASGGELTTYGSFTVSVGAANVNLDAAAGSIVNLNSTSGAESFTAANDNDFQMLGTVNIAGANGDYTLGGAFIYQFGSVNINTTGSLISTTNDATIEFAPSAIVDLAGSATLTLGSNTNGNEVVLDTVGDTGTFTIDRNASTNMTLNHINMSRTTYLSATGFSATCDNINKLNVDFTVANVNWAEQCPGGGGGGGGGAGSGTPDPDPQPEPEPDVAPDPTPEPDPQPEPDPTPDADPEPEPDPQPNPTPEPDVSSEDTVGDDGMAVLGSDDVEISVDGLDAGTLVTLDEDETGRKTLEIGDRLILTVEGLDSGSNIDVTIRADGGQSMLLTDTDGNTALTVDVEGLGEGADIDIAMDANGDQWLTLVDASGGAALSLQTEGLGMGASLAVSMDENGDQLVVLNSVGGAAITLDLSSIPKQTDVIVTTDKTGKISVVITDESGEASDVKIEVNGAGDSVTFTVTYNHSVEGGAARIVPGFPGLDNEESLGGSVTIAVDGLDAGSFATVALTYEDADITGILESDLRLHKLDPATGRFEPAGTDDVGVSAPTVWLGEYGVETSANSAWARVSTMGTFAVGVPEKDDVRQQVVDDAPESGCGAGGGACGAFGLLCLPLTMLTLGGMRGRKHRKSPYATSND